MMTEPRSCKNQKNVEHLLRRLRQKLVDMSQEPPSRGDPGQVKNESVQEACQHGLSAKASSQRMKAQELWVTQNWDTKGDSCLGQTG